MLYRIILIPFFVLCIFDVDLYVVSYSITKVENYDRWSFIFIFNEWRQWMETIQWKGDNTEKAI